MQSSSNNGDKGAKARAAGQSRLVRTTADLNEQLLEAVNHDDHVAAIRLLEEGADIDAALRLAASYGDVIAIKRLMTDGDAEPSAQDKKGRSALTVAIMHEQGEVVKHLLGMDVKVTKADIQAIGVPDRLLHQKRTPAMQVIVRQLMMKAVEKNDLPLLQMIGGQNADVNATVAGENHRTTPLMVAAANGHTDIVEFLLRQRGSPSRDDDSPEAKAMIHQMTVDVDRRDESGMSAFMLALHNGHQKVVTMFTDRALGRPSKKAERVRKAFATCMRDPMFGKKLAEQLAASKHPDQIERVIYEAIDAKARYLDPSKEKALKWAEEKIETERAKEDGMDFEDWEPSGLVGRTRYGRMHEAFDAITDDGDRERCQAILKGMPILRAADPEEGFFVSSSSPTSEAIDRLGPQSPPSPPASPSVIPSAVMGAIRGLGNMFGKKRGK